MSNVYRIGVNIAMTGNTSQFLGVLGRELLGIHGHVGAIEKGFSRWKLALGGALAIGAGVGILGMFKGPLEEAVKFQTEVTKFKSFGMGDAMTSQAVKFARGANIVGSSARDMMRIVNEAQGAFRESGESDPRRQFSATQMVAPQMAKLNLVQRSLFGMDEGALHGSNLAAYKFIEQRGGLADPAKFNAIMDNALKVYATSGGQVNFQQLRNFMSTAGVAGRGMSDQALYGMAEPLIAELGGQRAGTSLMTAYSRMNGLIKLPNQALGEYMRLGLWDRNAIELNSMGGLKRVKEGQNPLVGAGEFAANPFAYYESRVLPKYMALHYDQAQRDRENVLLFGRTGGAAFSLVDRQLPLMHRSVDAQAKALGLQGNYAQVSETVAGKRIELEKKWMTLQLQIGEHVLPMAISGLTLLNTGLGKISAWAEKHPKAMDWIVKGAVIVGAALVGLGVAAVAIAAFSAAAAGGSIGLIVAGTVAVVSAIGAFIALNWNALKGAVSAMWEFISRVGAMGAYIAQHGWMASMMPTGMRSATQADVDESRRNAKFGSVPLKVGDRMLDMNPKVMTAMAQAAQAAKAIPPPVAANSNAQGVGDVYLDGKKVGKVVAAFIAQSLGPGSLQSRPDPAAGLPSAGASNRR